MSATQITTLEPGSPEWAKRMSASKIAAVVGHSPYESRFSLWHKMSGNLDWDEGENADEKKRGHYLEPALRQWFRDQHPDLRVERTGTWERDLFGWQIASPDALVDDDDLLECKTSTKDWEWGEPGTDEVPVYYDDQAQWTLLVTGRRRCYFSVLTSFMEFREYVVDANPQKQAWLVDEADTFMRSLGRLTNAPSIDEHDATYRAIRKLHPDIEDAEVEIDLALAVHYAEAKAAKDDAETAYRGAAAQISLQLGSARVAKTATGQTVAYRRAGRGGSTPYLNPARGLTATFLTERHAS